MKKAIQAIRELWVVYLGNLLILHQDQEHLKKIIIINLNNIVRKKYYYINQVNLNKNQKLKRYYQIIQQKWSN
jgi:hypothetical protein